MSEKNIAEITTSIYELVFDLDPEQRKCVISAVMALFGEKQPNIDNEEERDTSGNNSFESEISNFGPKAQQWIRKNSLSMEMIHEVFHFDDEGNVEIIAFDLPGKNRKEKTASAYLVCGIQSLLQSDSTSFGSSTAVELCKQVGCHDKNHTANRNSLGNKLSGTVKNGFTLTSPGLTAAAEVIKILADLDADK